MKGLWIVFCLGFAPIGAALAQNLPSCDQNDLQEGQLCKDADGEIKKVISNRTSKVLFSDREKRRISFRKASRADLEKAGLISGAVSESSGDSEVTSEVRSCSAVKTCTSPSICHDCDTQVHTAHHTAGVCLSSDGVLNQVTECTAGVPIFAPMPIPAYMDPAGVFCGLASKPVKRKGITLCGCHEVNGSRLQTNPNLVQGQLCLSRDKFYIATKCEMKKVELMSGNTRQEGHYEHVATPTISTEEKSCQLEEASKEDLKLVRWIQKNQRFDLSKKGAAGMPPIGLPGMGMPGMPMPGSVPPPGMPMDTPGPRATDKKEGVKRKRSEGQSAPSEQSAPNESTKSNSGN